MAEGSGIRRWIKGGCLACLGLVVLLVVAALALFAILSTQARQQQADSQTLEHAPPPAAAQPAPEPARPLEQPLAGRVTLRLAHAGLHVEAAEPGQPLRVEATYDRTAFELHEDWQTPEGAPWTYELRFEAKGSRSIWQRLREMLGGANPELHVFLPPDQPIALTLELGQGGAKADLGGLRLTAAEIEIEQGGIELAVSRPLRAPLERLAIHAAMAGVETASLGNASPRQLSLDASMAGVELDLRGQWVTDSTIALDAKLGGIEVTLPDDVDVRGVPDRAPPAPAPERRTRPTLTFEVGSGQDAIEFH